MEARLHVRGVLSRAGLNSAGLRILKIVCRCSLLRIIVGLWNRGTCLLRCRAEKAVGLFAEVFAGAVPAELQIFMRQEHMQRMYIIYICIHTHIYIYIHIHIMHIYEACLLKPVSCEHEECDLRATVPDTLDFNTGCLVGLGFTGAVCHKSFPFRQGVSES